MRVVVQFGLDIVGRPVGAVGQRHRQNIVKGRPRPGFQLRLTGQHIDRVIMGGVQGGGGRRRHPGGVGAGHWVADFLLQHGCHQIRHRPHALADLGVAGQAASQPDVDIPILIGLDPRLILDVGLAQEGAGLHGGVDFVAGAVKEAGVDEEDARFGGADAFLQVDRGPPFLVHDAHFQGVAGQAQNILDAREQRVGEGDFFGAMHFRFDDVDRAGPAVAVGATALQVVDRR